MSKLCLPYTTWTIVAFSSKIKPSTSHEYRGWWKLYIFRYIDSSIDLGKIAAGDAAWEQQKI